MILNCDYQSKQANAVAYALFRAVFGVFLMINGWDKWSALPESAAGFPDPLGVGSSFSIYLGIFAELVCGLAIALGLLTRAASLPVIITFLVVVFMVQVKEPFRVSQTGILYLIVSMYIMVKGSGRFSLDHLIWSSIPEKGNKKIDAAQV